MTTFSEITIFSYTEYICVFGGRCCLTLCNLNNENLNPIIHDRYILYKLFI